MKIWKTIGCLALLTVLICGCAVLGQAKTASGDMPSAENAPDAEGDSFDAANGTPVTEESTATVEKTYSEGLSFRSNGDGTCAVSGLGSCTSACVLIPPQSPAGDTVTEILPYAFADTIVGAIELPGSVSTVSAASFAGCERLAYVRVAADNACFTEYDGVLYSADGNVLLYCPGGRTAREVRLHPALKRIAAGAFADCGALSAVYFPGNTSQWHALIVGDGNERLYETALKFNAQLP